MKVKILAAILCLIWLSFNVSAQLPVDGTHYFVGINGIKGGALPPTGVYFRDDNLFYYGSSELLSDYKTYVYAQAPQVMWMTPWSVLGINYGMAAMVPVVFRDVSYKEAFALPSGYRFTSWEGGNRFGIGDIELQPLLMAYHLKHFDFMGGYALWLPTGIYHDSSGVNLGDGTWTHMITLGGVWYPDDEKSWAVSVLNHYEFNSQLPGQRASTTFPGGGSGLIYENNSCSTYSLEAAISKTVWKKTDIGVVGYYQEQFDARGEGFKVAAIGPEIRTEIPAWGLSATFRDEYEIYIDNHPRGNMLDLAFTKTF